MKVHGIKSFKKIIIISSIVAAVFFLGAFFLITVIFG